jgi:hypothetical protein
MAIDTSANAEPTEKSKLPVDLENGVVSLNGTDNGELGQQEEDRYLHGLPLVLMTLSLMVGVLMISLDNSIIGKSFFLFN